MARLPSAYLLTYGSTISFYRHCLFAAGYSGSQSSENVVGDGGGEALLCLSSCCCNGMVSGVSWLVCPDGVSSVRVLNVTNSALLVRSNNSSISCLLIVSCRLAWSANVSNWYSNSHNVWIVWWIVSGLGVHVCLQQFRCQLVKSARATLRSVRFCGLGSVSMVTLDLCYGSVGP